MENEKFNLAIEEFQNSLENMNDNEINDIFYKLGFCALKINKFNDAIEYFENSIENVEKNTEKFFKESFELCKNGKTKEILIKSPLKIKELNNNLNEIYLYQGICYMNVYDYKKAIEKFDKCIEIDSKKSSNYYNKGICFTKLNKFKEANEMFELAIEFDKENKLYKQMYEKNRKKLSSNEKKCDLNKNDKEIIKKNLDFEHNF
jgi:tetratricopeptide (TPR) repeat protein